jgi:hypothetical protein
MDTANRCRGAGLQNKKGRIGLRPSGTFRTPEASAETENYLGVVGAAGAVVFGVVVGLGPAGLAVVAAGAGTPDCTL